MARGNGSRRRAMIALAALLTAAAPAATQAPGGLAVLARMEPGLWTLKDRDGARPLPSICIAQDRGMLMQIQHGSAACTRLVIAQDAKSATVHYTCPGAGFGRTSLRLETPRLARIDSQGIHDGAPFAFRAEARRAGPCPRGGGRRPAR
ncbi:MAG: DUF3617 domain-containing protein [Allosphingosinicella sp.]|uniref:DUF3617 domain-containing protein n=1 Tax=Allosphingosinicella sp. TaxID=2823234 RepID=UPI003943C7DE